MIFSSMFFLWIFLPLTFVGYFVVGKKLNNLLLLAVSLFFYAWGEPVYIALMLLSIVFNYGMALLLVRFNRGKKVILTADIVINLLWLGYF